MPEKNLAPCEICRFIIDLDIENYLRISEYHNGQFKKQGYYHIKCYKERLALHKKRKRLETQADIMFDKAMKLFKKVE